ncbi:hypothetical protein HG536_0F00300 [Torulaspora globosa]|uniref:EF-hand domain-containing protein n=1 Tax=Torulaspora globosa TaxID=48254 RepID=A0A7G3ZJM0_9SACH|nr:uncharacterized protein HG536_0F00300 [Torulaspora globosa]QLL33706.1 hypothetical protein HG536_0F00300 [Torulaspora globosa]
MQADEPLKFSQLSQNHIKTLKDAFEMLDDDGDSRISERDLRTVFGSVGQKVTDEQLHEMLQVGSTQQPNEGIAFSEFLSLMSRTAGSFSEDSEIRDCLRTLTDDQDLRVPLDDLVVRLKEAGFQDPEGEFAGIFKDFSAVSQVSGRKTFKGTQFLNTISE